MSNWISDTISNRRRFLTKKQFVFHYFFVVIVPLISILATFLFAKYYNLSETEISRLKNSVLKFAFFFSLAYSIVQYTRLQMSESVIELSNDNFHSTCQNLAESMNWIIEAKGENYLVCTTPFKWFNWGTLITIINTGESVLYNSVCDLHNRPATVSFGQNARNYKAIKAAFNQVK
ncbi:MAG: hypothetical protein ACKOXF_08375 [Chitinophagaceae bacterium]